MPALSNKVVEYILRLRDEASDTLERTGEKADRTADSADAAGASMANVGKAALGLATSLAAATGAFVAFQQRLADARNELVDMSTRTGVAAKTLAGLQLAAEGSGVSLGSLERALAGLPRRMQEAAQGTGPLHDAFTSLGVAVVDANGQLRDADVVLRETLTAIQAVESPTERAALATTLFSQAGGRLLQSLGTTELQAFVDQAERFGIDVGPQAAKAAGDWQRAMADLSLVSKGAADGLTKAWLGPAGPASAIDTVVEGIVYSTALAEAGIANFMQLTLDASTVLQGLLTGDIRDTQFLLQSIMAGEHGPRDPFAEASEALAEFVKNRDAILAGDDPPPGGGGGAPERTVVGTAAAEVEQLNEVVVDATGFFHQLWMEEAAAVEAAGDLSTGATHLQAALDGLAVAAGHGVTALDQLRMLEVDIELAFAAGNMTLQQRADALALVAQRARQLQAPQLGQVVGTVGAGLTGNIPGALGGGLSLAGVSDPIVGAIVTGVTTLATIGREGADSIVAGIGEFMDDLTTGISELDEVVLGLAQDLPEAVVALLEGLLENADQLVLAFARAMFQVLKFYWVDVPMILVDGIIAGVGAVWDFITPDWWGQPFGEVAKAVAKGVADWFAGAWDTIRDAFQGNLLTGGEDGVFSNVNLARVGLAFATSGMSEVGHAIGAFQSGGYVPRTQLALLHQGERVVAKGGALTGGARRNLGLGMGGGGPEVHIHTSVVDHDAIPALVRQLERTYGAWGRGTSPIFSGAG